MEQLGEPLNVKQAAKLIGCSGWTLRNRLLRLPNGPPFFRSAEGGKLIFYHDQVIRWILQRQYQQKGGNNPKPQRPL
ncbi:MAG: hypothetical protein JWO13_436 [Acidobacteriales bacterium]|nr:hypothetical protein [Terriglobales bacterium]